LRANLLIAFFLQRTSESGVSKDQGKYREMTCDTNSIYQLPITPKCHSRESGNPVHYVHIM
jgi:hypothetical protein